MNDHAPSQSVEPKTSAQTAIDDLMRWIGFPSVSSTTNDHVNQDIAQRLNDSGFEVFWDRYVDRDGVEKSNLIACRMPANAAASSSEGGVAYFCHTDVVPVIQWKGAGESSMDSANAFSAVQVNVDDQPRIYGRGACDMKGSLAAVLTAINQLSQDQQRHPMWIVCTADEEVGFAGAKQLCHHSKYQQLVQQQPLAIIGEPTSMRVIHAHKGIRAWRFISRGKAAHSGTDNGVNANRRMIPFLSLLEEIAAETRRNESLQNNAFEPTHLSWTYGMSDSCQTINIIPEQSVAWLSYRPMPNVDHQPLVERVMEMAERQELEVVDLGGGDPMWIDRHSDHIQKLESLTKCDAATTCYGTDGGEFAGLKRRVVIGPGSIEQAHTDHEYLAIEDLQAGIDGYLRMLKAFA